MMKMLAGGSDDWWGLSWRRVGDEKGGAHVLLQRAPREQMTAQH